MRAPIWPSLAALSLLISTPAWAAGGYLSQTGSNDVVGHDVVVSASEDQVTLYDRLRVLGGPVEYVWVIPMHGVGPIEQSSDLMIKTLADATRVSVSQPFNNCFVTNNDCVGGGVGQVPSSLVADPVARPIESTIVADYAALTDWLSERAYSASPELEAAALAYQAEGYSFAALRVVADGSPATVPVRVTWPRPPGDLVVPLRLVRSGASSPADVSLWIVSDRRMTPVDEEPALITAADLTWNWDLGAANYEEVKLNLLLGDNVRLLSAAEPLSPFAFDAMLLLAQNDPWSSGYEVGQGLAQESAQADLAALRGGLSSGATWISHYSMLVPAGGFAADLVLRGDDRIDSVVRALEPAHEAGTIPQCDEPAGGGDCFGGDDFEDFGDVDEGMADDPFGCSAHGRRGSGAGGLLIALALAARARRRLHRG